MVRFLLSAFRRLRYTFMSNEQYAKFIGVKIGGGNFIAGKDHWPSEPYLITIGSNCALTKGVKIFTHGGARVARRKYPNYDVFGMVEVGDYC